MGFKYASFHNCYNDCGEWEVIKNINYRNRILFSLEPGIWILFSFRTGTEGYLSFLDTRKNLCNVAKIKKILYVSPANVYTCKLFMSQNRLMVKL